VIRTADLPGAMLARKEIFAHDEIRGLA